MAIDIRATVTCSLGGTLISGSISDDYLQGSGLIKTKGSVEISGTITPAIGTVVTFSYVKDGITRSIPRKLRVLSSFADPFRRTTKVELGCKLTYLSDLKDPIKWDAFDDPENDEATEEDASIVTLPIYASSIMQRCLTELGITASSNPLTNAFSIPEFDFSSGYVQILNDLLVSESYFGYLDTSEVLQVRNLTTETGTGPVFTSTDIVDLGPIGVGQLPGEAVTVSYSTLKLKGGETCETDEDKIKKLNWEEEETVGAPESIVIQYQRPDFDPPDQKFYATYNYIPRTVAITTYDEWDRVIRRNTTDYYIGAAVNTQYYVDTWKVLATFIGSYESSGQQSETVETFEYKMPASGKKPESGYDEITKTISVKSEPQMAMAGAIAGSFVNDEGTAIVNYMPLLGSYIVERTETTYETQEKIINGVTVPVSKTITSKQLAYGRTQSGQQETARQLEAGATVSTSVANAMKLVSLGVSVSTSTGRSVGLQERPSQAERTNAEYNKDGDPNNGWRTESKAELELAVGSATAQRRIELSMPYAPDDRFSKTTSDPLCYTSFPSDAPAKAARYGRVQNRLLLGNRNGMNLQLSPERLPAAPFEPLYVQANGLTGLYRANGTSWAFDSNGIVASVDALFWAAVGGTGTFWFPVAPGITTLPTTPPVVDGQMNATTVVLPYNETAVYTSRVRLRTSVTKFDYSLTLLTEVPASVVKIKTDVRRILKVEPPAAALTLAAQTPTVSGGGSAKVPVTATAVAAIAPAVSGGSSVTAPAGAVTLASIAPEIQGAQSTDVIVPVAELAVAAGVPSLSSGASIAAPNKDIGIAAAIPSIQAFDADAAAYIAAVEAADGQSLEADVKTAINNFVVGCKADGIWTAIKASCILAGARTLTGALTPLKGTAPTNNNFVSGDYNRETGLVGNGSTKYLDSNRGNDADPQNSKHMAVGVSTSGTVLNTTYIGQALATGSSHLSNNNFTPFTNYAGRVNGPGVAGIGSLGTGLVGLNRSTSTGFVIRSSGTTSSELASASATPASGDILIFDGINKSNSRIYFYSIGESLNLALLDTRVTTLINAIAAAIP